MSDFQSKEEMTIEEKKDTQKEKSEAARAREIKEWQYAHYYDVGVKRY